MTVFKDCNSGLSFTDWLMERYHKTPPELYRLAAETGRCGDYYKMMEWYRRRWWLEKELVKELKAENPFAAAGGTTTE